MFDYWNGYRHCENMSSPTLRGHPQIPKSPKVCKPIQIFFSSIHTTFIIHQPTMKLWMCYIYICICITYITKKKSDVRSPKCPNCMVHWWSHYCRSHLDDRKHHRRSWSAVQCVPATYEWQEWQGQFLNRYFICAHVRNSIYMYIYIYVCVYIYHIPLLYCITTVCMGYMYTNTSHI